MGAPFEFKVVDRVGLITFNRPKTLNSLTFEVYAELVSFFEGAGRDDRFHVVVLTGTGKGFCSGGDVEDIGLEVYQGCVIPCPC